MHPAAPATRLLRVFPAVFAAVLYGCADAPTAVEPRIVAAPHFSAGPTIVVSNTDDAGAGSLRQAVIDAPDGATIQFDAAIAGKTIVLLSGFIIVNKLLTIEGPLASGMTISGGLLSRVFTVTAAGDLVLRNVSIIDGREKFGGGIGVDGTLTLDHALVANNEAAEGDGGGIFVRENAELTVINSTISGNTTPEAGGGIYSRGRLTVRNSTIAFNFSTRGGGVDVDLESFNARNSIFAFNAGGTGGLDHSPNCYFGPDIVPIFTGRNISSENSCLVDIAVVVAHPLLEPLANNGGPTKTHALAFGPGVDEGQLCSEATDQRYVSRNQGAACDIGAFEFTNFGTVAITISPNVAVSKAGVATVTGTIKCSAFTAIAVDIKMSQTQKTTGKFTTIIQGQKYADVTSCGPTVTSWTALLTPDSGKFENGVATGSARGILSGPFLTPDVVTTPVKVYQVK